MPFNSSGKRRGRPREFNFEEALDSAMRVFWEKGFGGASLSDLTRAMGISRPSLYMAFGSKESLFRTAMSRCSAETANYIEKCLLFTTARQGVEQILRDGVMMFTDTRNPGGCMIVQGTLTCSDEPVEMKREVFRQQAALEVALKTRFERAVEAEELPRHISSQDLAKFYSLIVQGLVLQARGGAKPEQLLRVVDVAMARWP